MSMFIILITARSGLIVRIKLMFLTMNFKKKRACESALFFFVTTV
ncbi:MAG: hypothetical protein ACI9CQ_001380 [Saprospiraceae bacterium]|jgi:hypothetical protein